MQARVMSSISFVLHSEVSIREMGDFLSYDRYFILGEAYFKSGIEWSWHCRWKVEHSDKCLF